jgi:murein DD-endopeptidase MepM/ murein hydrolase activator NlpD
MMLLSSCATAQPAKPAKADMPPPPAQPMPPLDPRMNEMISGSVQQGGLLIGKVNPACKVTLVGSQALRVSANGYFVFGVGRDEKGRKHIELRCPAQADRKLDIVISERSFNIENINGVPPNTVNPPPNIAARIQREQALVVAARKRDDAREDFTQTFIWPVTGRVSGVYGSQRIYNGTPKSWHSGLDVAAKTGTPIKSPAGGIITFADPGLYLTGGTVVIDHGHGISSNFLHLSRIDVKVGDRVEQGQIFGAVGATGRATGPHMHWGMNWFGLRIDPQLLVPAK